MPSLQEVEDIDFAYTTISLNDVYDMSFRHALRVIDKNGGKTEGDSVVIVCQAPQPVQYECGFEGLYPVKSVAINKHLKDVGMFEFEGTSVVFRGYVQCPNPEYVAKAEMYIDGELAESVNLPAKTNARRNELFWKYQLPKGKHSVTFKWQNPEANAVIQLTGALVYSDAPVKIKHQ